MLARAAVAVVGFGLVGWRARTQTVVGGGKAAHVLALRLLVVGRTASDRMPYSTYGMETARWALSGWDVTQLLSPCVCCLRNAFAVTAVPMFVVRTTKVWPLCIPPFARSSRTRHEALGEVM